MGDAIRLRCDPCDIEREVYYGAGMGASTTPFGCSCCGRVVGVWQVHDFLIDPQISDEPSKWFTDPVVRAADDPKKPEPFVRLDCQCGGAEHDEEGEWGDDEDEEYDDGSAYMEVEAKPFGISATCPKSGWQIAITLPGHAEHHDIDEMFGSVEEFDESGEPLKAPLPPVPTGAIWCSCSPVQVMRPVTLAYPPCSNCGGSCQPLGGVTWD